jgi:hypothetical protein
MPSITKRTLRIIVLVAAAAWFFVLRGQAGELLAASQLDGLPPAYRGPVDAQGRLELAQARALPYAPEELGRQFGKSARAAALTAAKAAPVQPGESVGFWVSDDAAGEPTWVMATLRYTGEQVLMYVDNRITVDQQPLEQAAVEIEGRILPQMRATFGTEASTGLDGDPRLAILHTPLASAGGYFSQADSQPLEVNRFSNRRKLIVIGSDSYMPGDEGYLMILAHEIQHMIHASQQPNSPAWFNEGMSMLAQDLSGYPDDELALIHMANPDLSLTDWSYDASETGEHYGAAQLFLRYFYEQYGGAEVLPELIHAGAGSDTQVFARLAAKHHPEIRSFTDLVADWAVANLVIDAGVEGGRYAYSGLPAPVEPLEVPPGGLTDSVSQNGVDYLYVGDGPRRLAFVGGDVVALTGAQPKVGDWMWWSGRGDAHVMTLTRAFDLRGVTQATLEFAAWYEIERHYDYAYVTVSADAGHTWQTLSGQATTREDPQGANLGDGLTGVSGHPGIDPEAAERGRWVEERMDLSPYAGRQILLRFWVVNDQAYNTQGLLLDEIRIPEIGFHDGGEAGDEGWQARGFARIQGGIAQQWALRLVVKKGSGIEVRRVVLDEYSRVGLELAEGERGVLVVVGASPFTDEPGRYQVEVSETN